MRIGLVGYHCRTGLGEQNRQIVKYCSVAEWLVKKHSYKPTLPLEMDLTHSSIGESWYEICQFVDGVDIILFVETPYFDSMIDYARARGKRIVCVPNQEWMPQDLTTWPRLVDLFICPTQHSYDQFKNDLPCTLFPWPIDVDRYPFRQRGRCEKFLFINGNGGWKGRKGMAVVSEALKLWPGLVNLLKIHSQKVLELDNNVDLYNDGDVLICPHHVDGLCLEIPEALACGLPVIATAGMPWREYPVMPINAWVERKRANRVVDWYHPDPADLVDLCQSLQGFDVSQLSMRGRSFAESRDWKVKKQEFIDMIKNGKARAAA